jgi:hypothetical protein
MAANLPGLFVKAHPTLADQNLPQLGPGALNAGFGRRQTQPTQCRIFALCHPLNLTTFDGIPIFLLKGSQGLGQALRQCLHRRDILRCGWQIIGYGLKYLAPPMPIRYSVTRDLEKPSARMPDLTEFIGLKSRFDENLMQYIFRCGRISQAAAQKRPQFVLLLPPASPHARSNHEPVPS